jgi:hypothetical protein
MSSDIVVLDDDTDMEEEEMKEEGAVVNDIIALDDDSDMEEAAMDALAAPASEKETVVPVEPVRPPINLPRHNLFDRDFSAILRNDTAVAAVDPPPAAAFIPRHDLFSSVAAIPIMETGAPPQMGDDSKVLPTQASVNIVDEEAERKTTAVLSELSDDRKEEKEMEVVISEAEREWRKQRRRRLGRICQRARGKPSFMRLVRANLEVSEDEEEEPEEDEDVVQLSLEQLPKRIRIDLDAELGLKSGGSTLLYHHASPPPVSSDSVGVGPYGMDSSARGERTPADEGWYEGTAAASFPEDVDFLSPIQQWIRQNIQFYSATKADAVNYTGSRRSAIVRGRVGLRCIHCAQAQGALGSDSTRGGSYPPGVEPRGRLSLMPSGALFYPSNILNASSNYVQKFQQHFGDCLNLPDVGRMQLLSLLEDGTDLPKATSRRSEGGLSNSLYNLISARRIGLAETDDDGLRFGRDLDCEPLPFTTVRWQVEFEQSSGSGNVGGSADQDATVSSARLTADAESEAVLAETVAATDETGLCRLDDRTLLTDYVFLTMRQMAVCHAVAEDFASRFKKPKLLRIGFAGFCCRWCNDVITENKERSRSLLDFSCRCFPSASENLTSVITSSFTVHLQKCKHVPSRIRAALLAYKKLHLRQMAQLSYGSQRKYYMLFWTRLRAEDKLDDTVDMTSNPLAQPLTEGSFSASPLAMDDKMSDAEASDYLVQGDEGENEYASDDEMASSNRSLDVPISGDVETKSLLQELEDNWDPAENNHVIVPADRPLVSDYVFLIMRQLKVVFPDEDDIVRVRRRITIPGLACMHCLHQEQPGVSPSGRSFSSAPDNFHSALNSSLYNHLQICVFVDDAIKRALTTTKKIHSAQCAKIKFGSQRKYFNQLYDRLRQLESKGKDSIPSNEMNKKKDTLAQFGFMEIPNPVPSKAVTMCLECRMVPLAFRAPDSVFVGRVPVNGTVSHSQVCRKSCLDLSLTADLLDEIIRSVWNNDTGVLDRSSFQEIIRAAVVDETLSTFLTRGWKCQIHQKRGIESDDLNDNEVDPSLLPALWKAFSVSSVDFGAVEASFQAFAREFEGMADSLRSHPLFLNLLMLISPSLVPNGNLDGPAEANVLL